MQYWFFKDGRNQDKSLYTKIERDRAVLEVHKQPFRESPIIFFKKIYKYLHRLRYIWLTEKKINWMHEITNQNIE